MSKVTVEFTIREIVRRTGRTEVDPEKFEEVTGFPFEQFAEAAEAGNDEWAQEYLSTYLDAVKREPQHVPGTVDYGDDVEWVDFDLTEEGG